MDQVPNKQLEARFTSLSLAFKTDRTTVDKRLGIQERSRDLAEQNIDRELQGVREAAAQLQKLCTEEEEREVVSKLSRHLDVLEHCAAKVSSRAEVFGAVQQEKRMCTAMDVMVTYTENLRRLREKEKGEVEEARKVLYDRHLLSSHSLDTGTSVGERKFPSLSAVLAHGKASRRLSEAALPHSASVATTSSVSAAPFLRQESVRVDSGGNQTTGTVQLLPLEGAQEARGTQQQPGSGRQLTAAVRRMSLERQKQLSLHSSTSSLLSSLSRDSSEDRAVDQDADTQKTQTSLTSHVSHTSHKQDADSKSSRSSSQTEAGRHCEVLTPTPDGHTEHGRLHRAGTLDLMLTTAVWRWRQLDHRKMAAVLAYFMAVVVVVVTFSSAVSSNSSSR